MPWSNGRSCAVAGCEETVHGKHSRCPEHAPLIDQMRGPSSQRGYGADYRAARTRAIEHATHCWKCGKPFTPDNPATGGHVKDIRAGGTVAHGIKAECAECKNRPHRVLRNSG